MNAPISLRPCSSVFAAPFLFGVLFLSQLALSSAATVASSTSAIAPSGSVIQSFTPSTPAGFSWRADSTVTPANTSWRDTGQSFTANEDFSLSAITLRTNNGTNAPALNTAFTLTLYTFADIYSNTPSSTVATFTGVTPSGSTLVAGTYMTFALGNSVALTSGVVYGFVLHYDALAGNRSITFNVSTLSNEYTGGRDLSVYVDTATGLPLTNAFTRGNSLEFYLSGTSSIPEPGTFALLGGASVLAFAIFRRRRP
jgi:hypothetical protein